MAERTVTVSLVAEVSNYIAGMQAAQKQTGNLAKNQQAAAEQSRAFVAKIGGSMQSLGNQIGGTVGNLLNTVGSGIDKVSTKAARLSTALEVGGGAAVAAGVGLLQLGSGAKEATDQLNAAIVANGDSVSKYQKQIDDAIRSGENFDHNAEDTQGALAKLVPATGSTSKALSEMSVVTDLAAARHLSLTDAATQVARILNGSGSRTLNQYGIVMDGVGSKTEQGTRALDELSKKLDGQASASVNNFGKQLDIDKTKVEDFVKDAAGPAGQVLIVMGGAANIAGVALDILRARSAANAAAQVAMAASTDISTASITAEGIAAEGATAGMGAMATGAAALAGAAGIALIPIAVAAAVAQIGTMTDAAYNNTISFKTAAGAAAAYNKQVSLIQAGPKGVFGNAKTDRGQALQLTTGANAGIGTFFNNSIFAGLDQPFQGATASISKIDASMAKLVSSGHAKEAAEEFTKWKDAAKENGISLSDLNNEFPGYTSAVATYAKTAAGAADSTEVLGSKFNVTAFNASQLKSTTDELEKSLSSYGSTAQSAESATEGWYSALDAANKSVKDNGKNIDDSTEKGRANNQSLYALATAADTMAAAQLKAKTPIDQVKASLDEQRQSFILVAEHMGYTADAATALATKLIGVTTTKYSFSLDGIDVATNSLDAYIKALNKIPGKVSTSFVITPGGNRAVHTGGYIDGSRVARFAAGGGYGQFRGPGSGTSDSIPAMVSNGEYINKASTVSRLGVDFFRRLNEGGSPAPVYMPAPVAAPQVTNINIEVPVSAGLISDKAQLAQDITAAIKQGISAGTVPAGWNQANH